MARKKDGEGMAQAMDLAIKNAGIDKSEIGYINAHGTSTTLNDKFETMAIKSVFGNRAYRIPVSSNKSMIGHTVGAAGVIEGAFTVLSVLQGKLPPTINLDEPDPELDLDYIPNVLTENSSQCCYLKFLCIRGAQCDVGIQELYYVTKW